MGKVLTLELSQLEARRSEYDAERRGDWEERFMPKLMKAKASKQDYISETLTIMYNRIAVHDRMLCATNSKVDSEYYAKIFEMASKDASLSETQRKTAKFLARELERRAKEDVVFEKLYIAHDLLAGNGKAEGIRLLRELKPEVEKLAVFYMKDMDAKLGENLSYIADPRIFKSLVAWNTIKGEVREVSKAFEKSKNLEEEATLVSFPDKLKWGIQTLASVRYYEDELVIAHARKNEVFKEVNFKEILKKYYD
jgi:hypothetical protein